MKQETKENIKSVLIAIGFAVLFTVIGYGIAYKMHSNYVMCDDFNSYTPGDLNGR